MGGPELLGSFTVYTQRDYDALSAGSCEELVRLNTAPLPSRVLHRGAERRSPATADDSALDTRTDAPSQPQPLRAGGPIRGSRSLDSSAYRRLILSVPTALAAA